MKKLLLALGAAALAASASATVYNQGEAFAYTIDPSFSFDLAGDTEGYAQYPVAALQGQASMEYGFGMASAWFNGKQFATPAAANEWCPVVEDPYNEGGYAIRMQTTSWDGFGNFNFALPEVGEPCRIRVIYRVDETAAENTWYADGAQKTFKVKLMHNEDQDDCIQVEEFNESFWDNPGWRVVDFIDNLDGDIYYMSLLWDAAGLSCQRNVPFYVEEVSVVPLSKLADYTAPEEGKGIEITTTLPDFVKFGGAISGNYDVYPQGEAFAYDIDPTFSFDLAGDTEGYSQYPVAALQGQASMEYGFGMASAWFNGKQFATPAEADEWCPVVEDPYNEGAYAIRMQTTSWDGFGNFNFALPEVGEPCRIRVVYRVDETAAENTWYADAAQKTFKVKLMHNEDQDDVVQVEEANELFWDNPGWRIAEFIDNLDGDVYYMSLLWDAAGLSCQRNVPFYVEEVSVVPLSKLTDYTAPEEGKALTVVTEMPTLVKIDRTGGSGISDVVVDEAASNEAPVYYNLQGVQVNNPAAGIYIVRCGKKVTKQYIR